jgi:hypothetical protein
MYVPCVAERCEHTSAEDTEGTHADVKALVAVAGRRAERHELRAGVGDGDLKVAVGVLLLEHDADRLLDVDQEPARRGRLLVVRHAPRAHVRVGLEQRRALRVVRTDLGLCARVRSGGRAGDGWGDVRG